MPSLSKHTRLQNIIKFAPQNCITADVGADHGLCSVELAKISRLTYYIDISPNALQAARLLIEGLDDSLKSKLVMLEGNGLHPLIKNKVTCDAVVIAGMGVEASKRILSGDISFERFNCHALNVCNVQVLILQPFPPNILPLFQLFSDILSTSEWDYDQQACYVNEGIHYITTSFKRCSKNRAEAKSYSSTDALRNCPLSAARLSKMKRLHQALDSKLDLYGDASFLDIDADVEEQAWLSYLAKQSMTLIRKLSSSSVGEKEQADVVRAFVDIINKQL
jgi:hypothetical protein